MLPQVADAQLLSRVAYAQHLCMMAGAACRRSAAMTLTP